MSDNKMVVVVGISLGIGLLPLLSLWFLSIKDVLIISKKMKQKRTEIEDLLNKL